MKRTTARAAPVLVSLRGPPDPNAGERRAEGLAQELDTTTTLLHRSRRDRHSMDELAPARSRRSMGLSEGRRVADPEHPWRTTIITSAPRTVFLRRNGQRSTLPLITVALMVPQEVGDRSPIGEFSRSSQHRSDLSASVPSGTPAQA